jgi:uncharacterized protein DUF397
MQWLKSSYSANQGQCVEVAALPDGSRAIRDSKDPHGRILCVTASGWKQFAQRIRSSEVAASGRPAQLGR